MNTEEILQYNKKCAEFLGAIYSNHAEAWGFGNAKNICSKTFNGVNYKNVIQAERFEKELKFHSDWNWIMEILNKISSLDYGWKITFKEVIIYSHSGDPRGDFDCKHETNSPHNLILDTVKTINQFLTWYNLQGG